MKFILGKKIEMTQIWKGESVVPVTKVTVGPCTVLQLKNAEKDGYRAVQLGYGSRRLSLITKALKGHFKDMGAFRYVREFRLSDKENLGELKAGDKISVATFAPGDRLTITSISKGKGFQGVVRRHGFHGQDATHGNKDQLRASGSVGAGGVQHVFKGTRMGGRMGGDRVTLHDVEIIDIDEKENCLFVKGGVPGARNSLVLLSSDGELRLGMPVEKVEEVIVEETPIVEEVPVVEASAEAAPAEAPKTEEVVEEKPVEEPVVVEEKPSEDPKVETEAPVETPKVEETTPAETPKVEPATEATPEPQA